MSKLAKFFVICAIVCCLGTIMFIAGYMTNGIDGIDKMSNKYDWMSGSPGEMQTEILCEEEFGAIDAEGGMDILLVGDAYKDRLKDQMNQDLYESIELNGNQEGNVYIGYSEKGVKPKATVEDGVLEIECDESGRYDEGAVNVNFSSWDGCPDVVVFCGDIELTSIDIDNINGDITMLGVAYEGADIESELGDVFMECVKSGGLKMELADGETSLHGDFAGLTELTSEQGDIQMETTLAEASYSRDIAVTSGDLTINESTREGEGNSIVETHDGGPNQLKINSVSGDVFIWFGDATF